MFSFADEEVQGVRVRLQRCPGAGRELPEGDPAAGGLPDGAGGVRRRRGRLREGAPHGPLQRRDEEATPGKMTIAAHTKSQLYSKLRIWASFLFSARQAGAEEEQEEGLLQDPRRRQGRQRGRDQEGLQKTRSRPPSGLVSSLLTAY